MSYYVAEVDSGSAVEYNYIVGPVLAASPEHAWAILRERNNDFDLVEMYPLTTDPYGKLNTYSFDEESNGRNDSEEEIKNGTTDDAIVFE